MTLSQGHGSRLGGYKNIDNPQTNHIMVNLVMNNYIADPVPSYLTCFSQSSFFPISDH